MSTVSASSLRLELTGASLPRLARHARLKFDKVREQWVLLVPERVLVPDATAIEIFNLCDGERSIDIVVDLLCEKYAADRGLIENDVIALLQDLADKGYLIDAGKEKP